jgi:enamine deaminase RidA (YjgF/YER057c/UK114 family)
MSVTGVTPDGWPRGAGYAHGMSARGRVVFTAGQVGWDPHSRKVTAGGFVRQVEQALANVAAILDAAGATPADVVRLTWFITDRQAYLEAQQEVGAAYRSIFGRHFPAMSVVVVAGLIEEGAMVEIEATAVVPDAAATGTGRDEK